MALHWPNSEKHMRIIVDKSERSVNGVLLLLLLCVILLFERFGRDKWDMQDHKREMNFCACEEGGF